MPIPATPTPVKETKADLTVPEIAAPIKAPTPEAPRPTPVSAPVIPAKPPVAPVNPVPSILSQKFNDSFKLPTVKTEHALDSMNAVLEKAKPVSRPYTKGNDPYRIPPEA